MSEKSKIKCFWMEPMKAARLSLRRYKGHKGTPCEASGVGYHNAQNVALDQFPTTEDRGSGLLEHPDYPRDHPQWPMACACGYVFEEGDHWQVNTRILYRASHDSKLYTLDDVPVGAMWDAWWFDHHKGPDGKCLVVKTPGGEWMIDSKAQDGKGWTRNGEPPNLTVTPSIGIGAEGKGQPWKYHGFLTYGYLVEC